MGLEMFMDKHKMCEELRKFIKSQRGLSNAWENCKVPGWLCWIVSKAFEEEARRPLVRAVAASIDAALLVGPEHREHFQSFLDALDDFGDDRNKITQEHHMLLVVRSELSADFGPRRLSLLRACRAALGMILVHFPVGDFGLNASMALHLSFQAMAEWSQQKQKKSHPITDWCDFIRRQFEFADLEKAIGLRQNALEA